MRRLLDPRPALLLALTCWVVGGCSSTNGIRARYTSPRVEGLVVDANTGQPIKRVEVHRNPRPKSTSPGDRPHAGEIQEHHETAYSDVNGRFHFPSKRNVEFGGDRTWISLKLRFSHDNYGTLTTNIVNHGDPREDGEPTLRIGPISLDPAKDETLSQ